MVAQGWVRQQLSAGDKVWVTRLEHHSNLLPWQRACQQTGAELCMLELDEFGYPLLTTEGLFDSSTKLIAITHVSNVLGVENEVAELCAKAAAHGIRVLVDGSQAVAHLEVDVEAIGCDFYAFSAHKMYGPTGIGALYAKPELLGEMEPLLLGGGMVDEVGNTESTWSEAPECFEAGSQNLAGAIGFAAAANYLKSIGMANVQAHISDLCQYAAEKLTSTSGVRLFTSENNHQSSLLSFELSDVHPHDVGQIAGEYGVAIRAGHHCCQPLMNHLGVAATNRVSFAIYNNSEDIDELMKALAYAQQLFGEE
jgi:cysteine desulfurase/selenocysteine lyase